MITPPLSISARPRLTRNVALSVIGLGYRGGTAASPPRGRSFPRRAYYFPAVPSSEGLTPATSGGDRLLIPLVVAPRGRVSAGRTTVGQGCIPRRSGRSRCNLGGTAEVADGDDEPGQEDGRRNHDQAADHPGGPWECLVPERPAMGIGALSGGRPDGDALVQSGARFGVRTGATPGHPKGYAPEDESKARKDDRRSHGRPQQTPGSASHHRRKVKPARRRNRGFPRGKGRTFRGNAPMGVPLLQLEGPDAVLEG